MRRVEKPWGYEVIWAETKDYVGKLLYIKKGHRLSKQYHNIKEETIYVVNGVLYNEDENDKITKILPGENFHVSPKQIHRFCAKECDVELMEVSTPHLSDVVRLEDDYRRKEDG